MMIKKKMVKKYVYQINGREYESIKEAKSSINWIARCACQDKLSGFNKKIACERRGTGKLGAGGAAWQHATTLMGGMNWTDYLELHKEVEKWIEIKKQLEDY
jgi:hypothetical protein